MIREQHDANILADLNSQLDDMLLVVEDKAEAARENIVAIVETLLHRLHDAEIPSRSFPIKGREMSPEFSRAIATIADELKRQMIGAAVPKKKVEFTVQFTADFSKLPTDAVGLVR